MKNNFKSMCHGKSCCMLIGAALALAASGAFASPQTVDIKYVNNFSTVATALTLPVAANPQTYAVGEYNFQIKGGTSFIGFCADPFQYDSSSYSPYTASLLDQTAGISANKLLNVEKLFGHAYADIGNNAVKAAGFQLALWEMFNDDGNLATGKVKATSKTSLQVATEAQSLLNALPGWDTVGTTYALTYYQSANFQDYLSATAISGPSVTPPVPEPSTAALTLAGLGLVGLLSRRRKNRKEN